jgi:hypothetical protein
MLQVRPLILVQGGARPTVCQQPTRNASSRITADMSAVTAQAWRGAERTRTRTHARARTHAHKASKASISALQRQLVLGVGSASEAAASSVHCCRSSFSAHLRGSLSGPPGQAARRPFGGLGQPRPGDSSAPPPSGSPVADSTQMRAAG